MTTSSDPTPEETGSARAQRGAASGLAAGAEANPGPRLADPSTDARAFANALVLIVEDQQRRLALAERDKVVVAKQLELQRVAIDRWVPCPGHRDKTVERVCMLCAMERVLNTMERAHQACADPSRSRQSIGEMLYFACIIAGSALGRLEYARRDQATTDTPAASASGAGRADATMAPGSTGAGSNEQGAETPNPISGGGDHG